MAWDHARSQSSSFGLLAFEVVQQLNMLTQKLHYYQSHAVLCFFTLEGAQSLKVWCYSICLVVRTHPPSQPVSQQPQVNSVLYLNKARSLLRDPLLRQQCAWVSGCEISLTSAEAARLSRSWQNSLFESTTMVRHVCRAWVWCQMQGRRWLRTKRGMKRER